VPRSLGLHGELSFRRPAPHTLTVAAARFDGERFLGGEVAITTAFVVSQLLGYTVS